jgi:MoxR-like ATPase
MPPPTFTLDDFQFLGKYDPAANYGTIPEADKQRFTSIRNRVRDLVTEAAAHSATAWNKHVSMLNPSGRTAKDYWCAIFPPSADNKSFAPQVATILLPRGVEICFCLGAGAGAFATAEDRLRNEAYLQQVRERLRNLPEALLRHFRGLSESWRFRSRWRLAPAAGEFDTLDAWLDHASSVKGAGASVSKYLTVEEAIARGAGLVDEFRATIEFFAPVLLHLDGTPAAEATPTPNLGPQPAPVNPKVWLIGAGEGARLWDRFRTDGHIAIEMVGLGDLRAYATRDDAARAIEDQRGNDTEPINDALACYEFVHVMKPMDRVYVKRGLNTLLGEGIVESDYVYEPNLPEYKSVRKVRWISVGEWQVREGVRFPVKTLTEITRDDSLLRTLNAIIHDAPPPGPPPLSPQVAEPPYTIEDALADTFLTQDEWRAILRAWTRKKNLVLQGSPGVGKTFLAKRLAYSLLGRKSARRVGMIQFHQSYSYEEFVEGYRPAQAGGLTLRDGFFKEFCRTAGQDAENSYVLIIDEINRGNISRILGELLALIEADKRGGEHAIRLAYSGPQSTPFHVPQNVFILGLMNTADRSLAFVDYALRRRFAFRTIHPAFQRRQFSDYLQAQGALPDTVAKIVDRLTRLNDMISADERNLGPGYRIGHSYFCPQRTEDELGDAWYRDVVESEVIPLVEEYWAGMPDKVSAATALLLP